MAGYVAHARIGQARPHRPAAGTSVDRSSQAPVRAAAYPDQRDPDCVELTGTSLDARLGLWLAGVRETWSQTTFFLFDPESWR
jgi:hypothetical protein